MQMTLLNTSVFARALTATVPPSKVLCTLHFKGTHTHTHTHTHSHVYWWSVCSSPEWHMHAHNARARTHTRTHTPVFRMSYITGFISHSRLLWEWPLECSCHIQFYLCSYVSDFLNMQPSTQTVKAVGPCLVVTLDRATLYHAFYGWLVHSLTDILPHAGCMQCYHGNCKFNSDVMETILRTPPVFSVLHCINPICVICVMCSILHNVVRRAYILIH